MLEFIRGLLDALLGAQFPKVAGLAGLLFILLGVIPGEIRWGRLVFPKRDAVGRSVAIILGSIFVSVPLISHFGNTIGLVNVGDRSNSEQPTTHSNSQPSGNLLIGTAQAKEPAGSYKLNQRSVVDISKSLAGLSSAIYVGDVHPKDPTLIVVFKSIGPNAARIKNGGDYNMLEIRGILSDGEIVLLDELKQGDRRVFTINDKSYVLKIDRVIWYVFGDDVVNVSISPK